MAWDVNARLANNVDITADAQGTWTKVNDVPTGGYVPQSGTMLLGNPYKMGVCEFRIWIRGVTVGGTAAPTRVDLVVDIEEADDASGTNVQPVCRFRMGTGAATATPTGYAYTKSGAPVANTTQDSQFVVCGTVTKPFLRYNADVTLVGGTAPTVEFSDVTIYCRGTQITLEEPPAQVNQ